jgi:hypothetical protein
MEVSFHDEHSSLARPLSVSRLREEATEGQKNEVHSRRNGGRVLRDNMLTGP